MTFRRQPEGVPASRPRGCCARPAFAQWLGPVVWTTLELTRARGRPLRRWAGRCHPFPRHLGVRRRWGDLIAKSGLTDFSGWYHTVFKENTPWGEQDSPAFVTAAEVGAGS